MPTINSPVEVASAIPVDALLAVSKEMQAERHAVKLLVTSKYDNGELDQVSRDVVERIAGRLALLQALYGVKK